MNFLDTPEKRDRRLVHLPMGRFGEAVEIAKAALFREWQGLSSFVEHGLMLIQWLLMRVVTRQ
jgi:hypothetical protein